ncbi:hypothetical protein OsI_00396 [Oryza sativa Indica Group]|uniref:Uncharacterized protein n=1 Tax=Oryza sativa subsp. indica TaxID=39946 RepID=B8AD98_ORYSI|nr:hypothetical protein OsI_00396 [Oryza sativa Indica Group]
MVGAAAAAGVFLEETGGVVAPGEGGWMDFRLTEAVASPPPFNRDPSAPVAMPVVVPDPASPPEAASAKKGVFMHRIFPFILAANIFIGGPPLVLGSISLPPSRVVAMTRRM